MKKLGIFLALLLAGCSATPPSPAPSPPPPPTFGGDGVLVPVQDFITKNMPVKQTIATNKPRAYILLDKDRTGDNLVLCEAFRELLKPGEVFNPSATEITTWWPTIEDSGTGRDCITLVNNFDYAKAGSIRKNYKLREDGIYILAIDQLNRAVAIDLTAASDQQIREATALWIQVAQKSPLNSEVDNSEVDIESNSLLSRVFRGLCGEKSHTISANDIAAVVTSGGAAILGLVVAEAGKELVCGRSESIA